MTTLQPLAALIALVTVTAAAHAQTPLRLTLDDALRLAREHSEAVDIARAGELRADADQARVRSERLPQVNVLGAYSRTLASEFSALQSSGPVCAPLSVNANAPLADRLAEIERAAACGAIGPTFNLSELPFGQRNIYQGSFSFSQTLYTGGRIAAQQAQADLARRGAAIGTTSAEAQVALNVTQAFFDAALSDRLVAIAESGFDQAAAVFQQTRQSYEAGRLPEFELLRAQVARDNQRPNVIRSRANRDVAYLRLRQLLELAPGAPIAPDVDLEAPDLAPPAPFAGMLPQTPSTNAAVDRSIVQQAAIAVGLREAGVKIARAARLPAIGLGSTLTRVGYPSSGAFPGVGDFHTNWSFSASVQVPVFTGHRLRAEERAALADLSAAQAQLKQARELAALDAATAMSQLTAAEAAWRATAGTIDQATRAYTIAELRNREGLSTQLELTDARLSLQLAQANRAQAARDLQVARARAALLPSLPVSFQ